MPILWGEKAQTRKASKSLETGNDNLDTSKKTFEKTFIVIGDSTDEDMIETVEKLNDVPRVGDRESNIGTCISVDVTESDFVCGGDDGKPVYEVTVKYDTSAEREGGADADRSGKDPKGLWQQPETQIPDYNIPTNSMRWTFEEASKKLRTDYNDRPTMNAVGEDIDIEIHYNLLVAEITCYTLRSVETEVLPKFNDTINQNVFAGYDPYRIKLNLSCDYEDIDLGDENHTICRWRKFVLKFTFDRKKKGDIVDEIISFHTDLERPKVVYVNTLRTAKNEEFLFHAPHEGTRYWHENKFYEIRNGEEKNKGFLRNDGDLAATVPTTITFMPYDKVDFSELSAYLDCDLEEWLKEGLESNAGEHLERAMKQMKKKNKKRNKKRINEIGKIEQNPFETLGV